MATYPAVVARYAVVALTSAPVLAPVLFGIAVAGGIFAPAGAPLGAWAPAVGVAVVAQLLAPTRRPALLAATGVGSFVAGLALGRDIGTCAVVALAAVVEAALVVAVLARRGPPPLRTGRDLGRLLVAAVAGSVAAASIIAVGFGTFGSPCWPLFGPVMAAHAAAVLVIVPLGMDLTSPRQAAGTGERVVLWTVVLAVAVVVFLPGHAAPLAFLPSAVLTWTGLRAGPREAARQLVVVALLTAALTAAGGGPFAAAGPEASDLLQQAFLVACALVVLLQALSTARREAAIADLAVQRRFDRTVLEVLHAGVLVCDAGGRIVVRNAAHRRMAGIADSDIVDPRLLTARVRVLDERGRPVDPDDTPLSRALAGGEESDGVPMRLGPPDGALSDVLVTTRRIVDDDGQVLGAVAACTDVTAERAVQARLRASLAFQEAVLAASPDLIFVARLERDRPVLTWISRDPVREVGMDAISAGFTTEEPIHPDDVATVRAADDIARRLADGQVERTRLRIRYPDGRYRWIARRVTPFRRDAAGRVVELVGVVRDVTEIVEAEERLAAAARHDPLTGLPNRRLLGERLDAGLRATGTTAVLYCDLDEFKHVNDTGGHVAGDAVLVVIAERLRGVIGTGDTVARVGGDEFVVLLGPRAVGARDDAVEVARRIQAALEPPIEVEGGPHRVSASIGIAVARTGDAPQDVLRDADSAMYQAKALGKHRFAVYDESLRADVVQRRHVQRVLGDALRDPGGQGLSVVYQPMIDLRDQRLVGVEALARLTDPDGRAISPEVFVPLAEASGLIAPLGRRVLDTACADLARWHARFPARRDLGVSVNISAKQADLTDLVAEVQLALAASHLAPSLLTVELTETVLVEAGHATLAALHALRAIGVRVAIDDFGTGYAGLRHLAQLPITSVKIDRSFTAGLPSDPMSATIVRTVAGLARELRLTCVAEGIETDAQMLALPDGLVGQGWLLGRPVSAEEIATLLAHGSTGRSVGPTLGA